MLSGLVAIDGCFSNKLLCKRIFSDCKFDILVNPVIWSDVDLIVGVGGVSVDFIIFFFRVCRFLLYLIISNSFKSCILKLKFKL